MRHRVNTYLQSILVLAMLPCMAIAVFGQVDSTSQPQRWLSIGAAFSGGPTFEYGNVVVPLCDPITSGSGVSWCAAALIDRPLAENFSAQLRVGAYVESGVLRRRGLIAPTRADDGTVFTGEYNEALRFDRTLLTGTLLARYQPVKNFDISIGFEAAHEIATSQIFQLEAVSPDALLFRGRRIDERASGEIVRPAVVAIGAMASIGYRLPLSRRSSLVPELSFATQLSSLASDDAWRRTRIGAGASIYFDLRDEVDTVPVFIDTPIVVRTPLLRPMITTSPAVVEVRVDEYDSLAALPLLNQVFFDEGSDSITSRYKVLSADKTPAFTMSRLEGSALDVYYDILNIVGFRLRQNPSTTLAITGYHNGRELDPRLSRKRAETIRRYLVDAWKIASRRIRAAGAGLPSTPARENAEEGFEENARALLVPSDPNITAPVTQRHVQRVATPPSLVFYPRGEAEAGLASWRLDVREDTVLWRRFEGVGAPPDSILWDWRSNRSDLPRIPMRLGYELAFVDSTGQRASSPRLPIEVEYRSLSQRLEHRVNDTIIESYSLLLFNYDSPTVSPDDQELLRAIAGTLSGSRSAMMRVTGYTDSLGLESYNRDLALRRANETARLLRELAPSGTTIVVNPEGGERERFPFNTPEGRSHSRTVVIEVRKPAAEKP